MVSMSDAEAILQILGAPDAGGGLGAPEIRERLQRRGIPLSQPTLSRRLSESAPTRFWKYATARMCLSIGRILTLVGTPPPRT
jgi:hypothetical protein